VNNNICNKILCDEIRESMPAKFHDYIDSAVYSVKQQLRLFKSQKPGTGRIKELVKSYFYGVNEIISREDTFENIFRHSCVTYTNNCEAIPIMAVIDKSLLVPNDNTKLTESDVLAIRKVINPNVLRIYEITAVKGRMILLKRKLKAHCTLCSRVHENENAFLTVTNSWSILFHCRREPNKFLNVGILVENSDSQKIVERQIETLKKRIESNTSIVNVINNINNINVAPDIPTVPALSIVSSNSINSINSLNLTTPCEISPNLQSSQSIQPIQSVSTIPSILLKSELTKTQPSSTFNLMTIAQNFGTGCQNYSLFQSKTEMPDVLVQKSKHQLLREIGATSCRSK
jgi:hypothetical protein